jgi:hypothetical protein
VYAPFSAIQWTSAFYYPDAAGYNVTATPPWKSGSG